MQEPTIFPRSLPISLHTSRHFSLHSVILNDCHTSESIVPVRRKIIVFDPHTVVFRTNLKDPSLFMYAPSLMCFVVSFAIFALLYTLSTDHCSSESETIRGRLTDARSASCSIRPVYYSCLLSLKLRRLAVLLPITFRGSCNTVQLRYLPRLTTRVRALYRRRHLVHQSLIPGSIGAHARRGSA